MGMRPSQTGQCCATDPGNVTEWGAITGIITDQTDLIEYLATLSTGDLHNHDDRYYTQEEINALLIAIAAHDHDDTYAPIAHNHDDRYFTEAEIIAGYSPLVHHHDDLYMRDAEIAAAYQPLDADLTAIAALATQSYGRSFLTLADAAAALTLLGLNLAPKKFVLDPNFAADSETRFFAYEAMTLTQMSTSGIGTVSYEKSTTAAPAVFTATASPITLEAGAWLRIIAVDVEDIFAVALERTA
jgi:hypothetical protein